MTDAIFRPDFSVKSYSGALFLQGVPANIKIQGLNKLIDRKYCPDCSVHPPSHTYATFSLIPHPVPHHTAEPSTTRRHHFTALNHHHHHHNHLNLRSQLLRLYDPSAAKPPTPEGVPCQPPPSCGGETTSTSSLGSQLPGGDTSEAPPNRPRESSSAFPVGDGSVGSEGDNLDPPGLTASQNKKETPGGGSSTGENEEAFLCRRYLCTFGYAGGHLKRRRGLVTFFIVSLLA